MTVFEELVERIDAFILCRHQIYHGHGPFNVNALEMAQAKQSLVAAIEALHGQINQQDPHKRYMEALSALEASLSPTPPVALDPDRWAKAAFKAHGDDSQHSTVGWDDLTVLAQNHWRLIADAVRQVKP